MLLTEALGRRRTSLSERTGFQAEEARVAQRWKMPSPVPEGSRSPQSSKPLLMSSTINIKHQLYPYYTLPVSPSMFRKPNLISLDPEKPFHSHTEHQVLSEGLRPSPAPNGPSSKETETQKPMTSACERV